ncbi:hypothetical protein [Streptomyces tsukubensis]|uniref:Uncharacterized protein n=1 Tax=Streptomyces tsukubensis TaxID=83656 RepID=A0A1V4A234_9ACTN|nr:hypothetical protein [Streptomyces tsukubensis]OON73457.1 hypothetical protein B1H18_27125 [Streptomyces tsukubensis]QFR96752.1 hypothetical protein GBW32_31580 [Streptomyces tsukubensis]
MASGHDLNGVAGQPDLLRVTTGSELFQYSLYSLSRRRFAPHRAQSGPNGFPGVKSVSPTRSLTAAATA